MESCKKELRYLNDFKYDFQEDIQSVSWLQPCPLQTTRSFRFWKLESATKWLSTLWRNRNNDLPRRKRTWRWQKKGGWRGKRRRKKPRRCVTYAIKTCTLIFKSQWKLKRRRRKRKNSIPAVYRRLSLSPSPSFPLSPSFSTLSLSCTLSCLSPTFFPKIYQIYFSVNRVEYNWCWLKRKIRKKKEKSGKRKTRGSREKYIYQNYFCVEEEDGEGGAMQRTKEKKNSKIYLRYDVAKDKCLRAVSSYRKRRRSSRVKFVYFAFYTGKPRSDIWEYFKRKRGDSRMETKRSLVNRTSRRLPLANARDSIFVRRTFITRRN